MDKILNGVEAIIYINRSQDFERNSKFLERWSSVTNKPLHRIEAVVPQSVDLNGIVQTNIDRYYKSPYEVVGTSPQELAEICCSMSHAKAWEFAKMNRFKKVLILEDDAIPADVDGDSKIGMANLMPQNTLLTYLNYLAFTDDCGTKLTSDGYMLDCYARNNGWAITEGGIFSTSAYIVNFGCITEIEYNDIISTMTSGVIIDSYFSFEIQSKFRCAIPKIKLVNCDSEFKSTIGDNYKGIVEAYENDVYKDGYVFGATSPLTYFENKYRRVIEPSKYLTISVNDTYADIKLFKESVIKTDDLEDFLTKDENDAPIGGLYNVKVFTTTYGVKNSNKGVKEYLANTKKEFLNLTTESDDKSLIERIESIIF